MDLEETAIATPRPGTGVPRERRGRRRASAASGRPARRARGRPGRTTRRSSRKAHERSRGTRRPVRRWTRLRRLRKRARHGDAAHRSRRRRTSPDERPGDPAGCRRAGLPVSPPERPRVLACEPDARRHGDGRGPPRSRRRDDGAGQRRQPSPFGPTTGPPGRSSASSPTTRSRRMPPRSSHWLSNGPPPSSPAPAVPVRRRCSVRSCGNSRRPSGWSSSRILRNSRSTPSRRLGGTSSRCERTAAMGREFRQRRRCERASRLGEGALVVGEVQG